MFIRNFLKNIYFKTHFFTNSLYEFKKKDAKGIGFLTEDNNFEGNINNKVKEVIYCFWTGINEMSENRKESLNDLYKFSGVEVLLITPNNLKDYILDDFPLHKAYPYLSNVHKSDYLRCYFMHHYGGGYTDIKRNKNNWKSAFDKLNSSNNFALGYREISYVGVGYLSEKFELSNVYHFNKLLKFHYLYLIGNGAYIFRSKTKFTHSWINEVHRRLDLSLNDLQNNPGNILGDNENYPLPWISILGEIFHPLSLKYHKKIIKDNTIIPEFKNYR